MYKSKIVAEHSMTLNGMQSGFGLKRNAKIVIVSFQGLKIWTPTMSCSLLMADKQIWEMDAVFAYHATVQEINQLDLYSNFGNQYIHIKKVRFNRFTITLFS